MSEIYTTGTDGSGGSALLHIHPPLLAAGLLVLGLVIHVAGGGHRHPFPLHEFLGLLIVAGGIGLSSYAAALFASRNTTKNPYGEPDAFVVTAPYTFTRNPMYVGLTAILFGFATFFGSPVMLLAPIAFAVIITRMVIPQEEQTMERLYGEQYREYKSKVPRWLPVPFGQSSSPS
ncbi:MAG TPA: isoprenylcysteine carboxylmethyltransferase family protein [Candidatus Binataceae bacterium]|nr:isoprenylcysteine carboxylmethyltransferase family protein [Candidatus Binataceae bacterium]